jgi:hypothetical protein
MKASGFQVSSELRFYRNIHKMGVARGVQIFMYLRRLKKVYCKNREKTRSFLEAVSFIMRTGVQWIELPKQYGNYKNIHKRFLSWAKKDTRN